MSGDPEMFERPSNSASTQEKSPKTKGKKQGTNKVWKDLNDFCSASVLKNGKKNVF